jgi:hypothetical protein
LTLNQTKTPFPPQKGNGVFGKSLPRAASFPFAGMILIRFKGLSDLSDSQSPGDTPMRGPDRQTDDPTVWSFKTCSFHIGVT